MAGDSDAWQHIRLKKAHPFRIRNLKKRGGFEDSKIIHDDVEVFHASEELFATLFRGEVGCNSVNLALNFADGPVHALFCAAIYVYKRSFASKKLGNGHPDARC